MAYSRGYDVLVREIIEPLFQCEDVKLLDVFLLSGLNLKRRAESELHELIEHGTPMLWRLIDHCQSIASVRTVGTFLPENIEVRSKLDRQLTLVVGSTASDDIGCDEVDVFMRSGGEIRLSGAPRTIVGNYTQFYGLATLHPELRFGEIEACSISTACDILELPMP